MKSDVFKLNNAKYYGDIIQLELDNYILSGEISEEEYNKKCNALINSKLYVEKKAIDVIKFNKHLTERKYMLEEKIKHLEEQIENADYWIDNSDQALVEWMGSDKKVELEEYILTIRPSKSVEILDEKIIPKKFWYYKEPERSISKKQIKEAIDNGENVPGARVVKNKILKIED
jgi:hypothetical protein